QCRDRDPRCRGRRFTARAQASAEQCRRGRAAAHDADRNAPPGVTAQPRHCQFRQPRPQWPERWFSRGHSMSLQLDSSFSNVLERNLAPEPASAPEAAALSASRLMGRGDEKAADQAAVDAMRKALNSLNIEGTVVIGEGERDEAPMLYIGEKVGSGDGPKVDIALDPLEGTTITAKGGANALAVIAIAYAGGFLNPPAASPAQISSACALPH